MKTFHSQNNEEEIIAGYFENFTGILLDVGANDGKTLSNSYALIKKGWRAALVEPSCSVAYKLWNLYSNNRKVEIYEMAIAEKTGRDILWDSGELLGRGDKALVSTLVPEETKRWASLKMPFKEIEVSTVTFDDFMKISKYKQFQFISIDAEGMDVAILKQMNLNKLDCQCLCIEHNGKAQVVNEILAHCRLFGLKHQIGYNQENIILARRAY